MEQIVLDVNERQNELMQMCADSRNTTLPHIVRILSLERMKSELEDSELRDNTIYHQSRIRNDEIIPDYYSNEEIKSLLGIA
jgi:hypothetical protein